MKFQPWKLAVSLTMTPPDTRTAHPFQDMTVGKLTRGTSNRSSEDFNSLTSWQYSGKEIELRIPWMLLGFADPSSLQVVDYGPLKKDRTFGTAKTSGITFVPWVVDRASGQVIGSGTGKGPPGPEAGMGCFNWRAIRNTCGPHGKR